MTRPAQIGHTLKLSATDRIEAADRYDFATMLDAVRRAERLNADDPSITQDEIARWRDDPLLRKRLDEYLGRRASTAKE
jgi:hypothetical protein